MWSLLRELATGISIDMDWLRMLEDGWEVSWVGRKLGVCCSASSSMMGADGMVMLGVAGWDGALGEVERVGCGGGFEVAVVVGVAEMLGATAGVVWLDVNMLLLL